MIWDFDPVINSQKDWRNKYSGCVIKCDGKLSQIAVHDDTTVLLGEGFSSKESGIALKLEPWLPHSTWALATKNTLFFARKIPNKQWHRSFCSGIYDLLLPHLPGFYLKAGFFNLKTTWEAIDNPTYFPISAAVDAIKAGNLVGVPLSAEFALTQNNGTVYSICSSTGLVGYLNSETRDIKTSSSLVQEMFDLLAGDSTWKVKPSPIL